MNKRASFWQKPKKQGDCDGWCGPYSLINATRRMVGLKVERDCNILMLAFQLALNNRKKPFQKISDGVRLYDMLYVIRMVLSTNYKVKYVRLFAKRSNVGLPEFWETCAKFLKEHRRAVIVLPIEALFDSHWTVAWQITEETMEVLDSGDLENIPLAQCTMDESSAIDEYRFLPSQTIFLYSERTRAEYRIVPNLKSKMRQIELGDGK